MNEEASGKNVLKKQRKSKKKKWESLLLTDDESVNDDLASSEDWGVDSQQNLFSFEKLSSKELAKNNISKRKGQVIKHFEPTIVINKDYFIITKKQIIIPLRCALNNLDPSPFDCEVSLKFQRYLLVLVKQDTIIYINNRYVLLRPWFGDATSLPWWRHVFALVTLHLGLLSHCLIASCENREMQKMGKLTGNLAVQINVVEEIALKSSLW